MVGGVLRNEQLEKEMTIKPEKEKTTRRRELFKHKTIQEEWPFETRTNSLRNIRCLRRANAIQEGGGKKN
jgi:hypothetical protein